MSFFVDERSVFISGQVLYIPSDDKHPVPSEIGVGGRLADPALTAHSDLGLALRHGDVRQRKRSTRNRRDHRGWAYYMSAEAQQSVGYTGQWARPVHPDPYPAYVAELLLDHLLDADFLRNIPKIGTRYCQAPAQGRDTRAVHSGHPTG